MLKSFYPRPKLFFLTAALWGLAAVLFWIFVGKGASSWFGIAQPAVDAPPPVGARVFIAGPTLWFYGYFLVAASIFCAVWTLIGRHRWTLWSVWGSALLLFSIAFQVQVDVAINNWRLPFFDMVQAAVTKSRPVAESEYFGQILTFAGIALVGFVATAVVQFFASHFVFRWRTAMNEYYMANWERLRKIEGASQRVQEDTMRFATTTETLGLSLVQAVMTLIAFMPVLIVSSKAVTSLPIVGVIPYPLVVAALFWAMLGTAFLAVVGIRLPGLEFKNQRVEAAYRKELVYGEDDPARADPPTVQMLFSHVRRNYFRLYFNYLYFNIARNFYLQSDAIFPYVILAPTIIAGRISFGMLQQILGAFGSVRDSFLYLVNSWPTIVELISIQKRLRAFEATLEGEPLPELDQRYLAQAGEALS
jgi:peptide/bleomycin uptake transporter